MITLRKLFVPVAALVALLATAVSASAAALPAVPVDRGISQYVYVAQPTSIHMGAGGGLWYDHIKFTKRTSTYALAIAVEHANTCVPHCFDGKILTHKAYLTFHVVTKAKVPYFNCMKVTQFPAPSAVDGDWETWNYALTTKASTSQYGEAPPKGKINCGYDFTT